MEIKIKVGDYEVIGSGTIVSNVDETIEFQISNLIFVIEFRNDSEKVNNRVTKEAFNNNTSLRLIFYNYNNSLGTGNISPVSIGSIGGRRLFINYRVYALTENSGKTLHYSFLLEKEVSHGK